MLGERDALEAGVTLIEMLVVVGLMAIFVGISFSSFSAGLSSVRLQSAASEANAFLAAAETQVEQRQEPVDVQVTENGGAIAARSVLTGKWKTLHFPAGVHVAGDRSEHMLLYPGGATPHFALELVNDRGARRSVSP